MNGNEVFSEICGKTNCVFVLFFFALFTVANIKTVGIILGLIMAIIIIDHITMS